MASPATLEIFNPEVESIDDYKERFDFHCTAHDIPQRRRKALFLTRIGREAFIKLKTLVSPTPLDDLSLTDIIAAMKLHYKKETVEIAERFKFFKRVQHEDEEVPDYVAELRRLGKTCNFGDYLDTALRDQLVCGLKDQKTQKELLCIQNLTLTVAIERSRAAEAVNREVRLNFPVESDAHKLYTRHKSCHRCGKSGHTGATCIHKNKRCHLCNKVGHLSSVCRSKDAAKRTSKTTPKAAHTMEASYATSSSDEDFDNNHVHVHKTSRHHSDKLTTVVSLQGVNVTMEIDTGAELSTIPVALYAEKLSHLPLQPSTVSLRQYDGSALPTKGEIEVTVSQDGQEVQGTFVIVGNADSQLPLLGRDWLYKLRLDWPKLFSYHGVYSMEATTLQDDYPEVFKEELGLLRDIEAEIELSADARPKFCKSRSVPFALRDQVEATLRAQVDEGELEPVEHSEWAPIVVVTKKDGGIRICADFKMTINPYLHMKTFPLPTPDEVFSTLSNGESFTKLDLARAYKQMRVAKGSQGYLTINTPLGLFKYLRLPFGIASAPAIWQRAMATVLQGCPGVVYYLDDILVTGVTREEHVQNLKNVMSRLQGFGLRLNASKCRFFQDKLEFLGHVITPTGVSPTQQRVNNILDAAVPTNKAELKSFLGLMTYVSKFLPLISSVLHPLYQLLGKNVCWTWSHQCQSAFDKAKVLVSQAPVLAHYDVHKPLKLYCDASPTGLGACLMHVIDNCEQPVAYASRTLSKAERNYAQVEREALSIIFGVKRFNQYLYGRHFTLVTDHRPLCKLFGHTDGVRPLAAARMQRWALILSAYSYKIEYTPGVTNQCADCLSRLPVSSEATHPAEKGNEIHATHSSFSPVTACDIARKTAKDRILSTVFTCVQHGSWPHPIPDELVPYHRRRLELTIQDDCILWGKRVIIPKVYQTQLLTELHVGHIGICRMKALARSYVWWPGLDYAIELLVGDCEACKITAAMPAAVPRHPWQHPAAPWDRVHIDYGEWKNHHFLVLVDAFSKWPEVKVVSTTTTRMTVNTLSDIFATHGYPRILVSDNGPQFTSAEFADFLLQNNIVHYKSPPYHPSTNGLAENMVKNVKHHFKKHKPTNMSLCLSDFLRTYRNTPHTITNKAPAHLILSQAPRTHLSMVLPSVYQRVKSQLQPTPEQTTVSVRKFQVGDAVLVRDLRPLAPSKWQHGTILSVLGKLLYMVSCEGHQRQVHIDQLLPAGQPKESSQVLQAPAKPGVGIAQRTPIIVTQHGSPPVIDLTKSPDAIVTETRTSQTVPPTQEGPRRSPRVKRKPKRLIEDDDL